MDTAPFDPESLRYTPKEAIWIAAYALPRTAFELEVTVVGPPEAPDAEALAMVSKALSSPEGLVLDARLPRKLFALWAQSEEPDAWTIAGVHCGRSAIYRSEPRLVLWWWFLHSADTYGCYYAGYDRAVLGYSPLLVGREQW